VNCCAPYRIFSQEENPDDKATKAAINGTPICSVKRKPAHMCGSSKRAVGRSLLIAPPDYFEKIHAEGLKQYCIRKLEQLGHRVLLDSVA